MRALVVDGKKIAAAFLNEAKKSVAKLKLAGRKVKLAVVLVGADQPARVYVSQKGQAAQAIGLDLALHHFPASIKADFLIEQIKHLQADPSLAGLIVQLPLPKDLNQAAIIEAIDPQRDVDCLTNVNLGRIMSRSNWFSPPTAAAIMAVLKYYKINLRGAPVAVVGAGELVGRPLLLLLLNEGATITVCHSSTKNLAGITKQADIIISGVGKKNLIRGSMIKKGAVVLDAGFGVSQGKVYGDINFSEVVKRAGLVTPTPGGIGPVTVALLLLNTVKNAARRI